MIRVCGVRFQEEGKMFYYNAGELEPSVGEYVIADTERGIELGEVMLGVTEMAEENIKVPLPGLVRIATPRDVQQATENRAREQEAYVICQRKIAEHRLEMKLVSVESTFDNSKLLFYFTANGRIDFRTLVRDLASHFKTRIELRQIGVRDEARMLGGLGPCGRQICCGTYLKDFQPVSIRMAKDQNLSLNPTKISGVCGRLMCCLKYEQDQYEQTRKKMPRMGREVQTPDGIGTVTDLNILKETVSVRISTTGDIAEIREYPLEKITRPGQEVAPAQEEMENETLSDLELEMETGLENDPALAEVMDEDHGDAQAERPNPTRGERRRSAPRAVSGRREKPEDRPEPEARGSRRNGRGNKPEKPENENGKPSRDASRLGQPVRRENPDREKKEAPAAPEKERSEARPKERNLNRRKGGEQSRKQPAPRSEEKKPAPATGNPQESAAGKKSKGWAEALEKALEKAEK